MFESTANWQGMLPEAKPPLRGQKATGLRGRHCLEIPQFTYLPICPFLFSPVPFLPTLRAAKHSTLHFKLCHTPLLVLRQMVARCNTGGPSHSAEVTIYIRHPLFSTAVSTVDHSTHLLSDYYVQSTLLGVACSYLERILSRPVKTFFSF